MKKVLLLLMIGLSAAACADKYSVSGTWPQGRGKSVTLKIINTPDTTVVASAAVNPDGTFNLTGKLDHPQRMSFFAEDYKSTDLFVSDTPIVINLDTHMGSRDSVTTAQLVECAKEQAVMEDGVKAVLSYSLMQLALPSAFNKMFEKATSQVEIDSLMTAFNEGMKMTTQMAYDYLDSTSNNAGSLYAFQAFLMYLPADSMSVRYDNLSPEVKKSVLGQETAALLKKALSATVNGTPDNFVLMSDKGEPTSLYSMRGNYLILDFWASWCHPCREEMPYLKSVYNQYHDKGLEIMSVSIDDSEDAWKQAIAELELPWVHVSSLKGSHCPVAKDFGVTGVPRLFILDPDGKIIADGLRGDDLVKFITEIYSK
ncbi:MAG: AhpC/TSA family protein [Bacteroidales bacterium]|nr:AhpC/TSA family protein [Bacteroidales bacterium]